MTAATTAPWLAWPACAVLVYALGAWLWFRLVSPVRSGYLCWPLFVLFATYCLICPLLAVFVVEPYRFIRFLWLDSRRT